jgi:hypothetical protein
MASDAAQNGYFLILEIFLRPILTVMALVIAITVFTAQVRVLNFMWDLVTDNVTGRSNSPFNTFQQPRSIIDQFFFTVLYAVVVYLMAVSSFKLINSLPDRAIIWMGGGAKSFGESSSDELQQGLQRYAALGALTVGQEVTDGVQKASTNLGGAIGKALGDVRNSLTPGQGK